jgi:hypothetical protein
MKCNCNQREAEIELTARTLEPKPPFAQMIGSGQATIRLCIRCTAQYHLEMAHLLINQDKVFDEPTCEN